MADDDAADSLYEAPAIIRRMRARISSLLSSLSPDQLAVAQLPLTDLSRLDWDFVPRPLRTGLPLSGMTAHQRTLAHALLYASMGERAYTQTLQIMAMENVLRELEMNRSGVGSGDSRDPDKYFFTIYGLPWFHRTWAWRIQGHHVCICFTIIENRYISVTPSVFGSQPANYSLLDPLGEEEAKAFALMNSLDGATKSKVVIHDVAPADFVTRQMPLIGRSERPEPYNLVKNYRLTEEDRDALQFRADEPAGISTASLSSTQAEMVRELVQLHLSRAPLEIAEKHLERVDRDGPSELFFCWAGGLEPGTPHYFRIQGTHLLIEFDNATDGAHHIHSIWRDYRNDLGHDLLLRHYEAEAHEGGPYLQSRVTSDDPWPNDVGMINPIPPDGM